MKKLSDLSKKEKSKISDEIDALGSKYTAGKYSGEFSGSKVEMGLCSTCKELLFTKTQYGNTYAMCERWDKTLNGIDLVVRCGAFRKRGEMSLYDMKDIAVLIDVQQRKIGMI